jgi:hypothetical protein
MAEMFASQLELTYPLFSQVSSYSCTNQSEKSSPELVYNSLSSESDSEPKMSSAAIALAVRVITHFSRPITNPLITGKALGAFGVFGSLAAFVFDAS